MNVTVTKEYKDRFFRLVFQGKKDLLSLYNAVNKSSYTDYSARSLLCFPDNRILCVIMDCRINLTVLS